MTDPNPTLDDIHAFIDEELDHFKAQRLRTLIQTSVETKNLYCDFLYQKILLKLWWETKKH